MFGGQGSFIFYCVAVKSEFSLVKFCRASVFCLLRQGPSQKGGDRERGRESGETESERLYVHLTSPGQTWSYGYHRKHAAVS